MEEIYCCLSLCVCLSETTLLLLLLHSRKKTETKAPGIFLRLLARLTSSSLLSRSPAPRDGVDALDGYLSPYHSSLRLAGCPLLPLVPSVLIKSLTLTRSPAALACRLTLVGGRRKQEVVGHMTRSSFSFSRSATRSHPQSLHPSIHPAARHPSSSHTREEQEGKRAREREKERRR